MYTPPGWPPPGFITEVAGRVRHPDIDGDQGQAVLVRLSWFSHDPYAVHTEVRTGRLARPVRWVWGRDLLAEGLSRPSGHGDVQVHPDAGDDPAGDGRAGVVVVALRAPSGSADITLPADEVERFLVSTFAEVPAGTESMFCDLDTELTRLLAG